ncbi:MAG: hypothetical protein R3E58_03735 [Phycisphaerae bacterium]
MNDSAELDAPQTWLDRQVHARPELPYIAPFMTFLALMAVGQFFEGPQHLPWLYTLRTVGALVVSLMFWKYFPPLGKPHILLSIVLAVVSTAMWIYVHKWFAAQSWYPKTQIMGRDAEPKDYYNCYEQLGRGWALWLFLIVRIGGASIVVPIVEEIFQRGSARVLIDLRAASRPFRWGCTRFAIVYHLLRRVSPRTPDVGGRHPLLALLEPAVLLEEEPAVHDGDARTDELHALHLRSLERGLGVLVLTCYARRQADDGKRSRLQTVVQSLARRRSVLSLRLLASWSN